MAEVEFSIAGRPYRVACRTGEEANLRAAAALVDEKSREALSGLGTLSEARQFFFAALLLADQLVDRRRNPEPAPAPAPEPLAPPPVADDPAAVRRAGQLADRLEFLAQSLEDTGLEDEGEDAYIGA